MDSTERGSIYDHDIPSLTASLEAFDPERTAHSVYSNMHSSRWSAPSHEQDDSEAESDGPWAPPAWQRSSNNHWYRKSLLSESPMRSSSSPFDREITPSRIPLPESPSKGTPRTSPEPPMPPYERHFTSESLASRMQSPLGEPQHAEQSAMEVSRHEGQSEPLDGCTSLLPMRLECRVAESYFALTRVHSCAICCPWRDLVPYSPV